MKNLIKCFFPSEDLLNKEAPALSYSLTLNIYWLVTEKFHAKPGINRRAVQRKSLLAEDTSGQKKAAQTTVIKP